MLSNAYFLAKFRFDTAENEPAKNLQNFRKMHFSNNELSKDTCDARHAFLAAHEADIFGEELALPLLVPADGELHGVAALVERFDIEPYPDFSAK